MSSPVIPAPDQQDLDMTLVVLLRHLAERGIAIAIESDGSLILKAPHDGITRSNMQWLRRHHDAVSRLLRSRREP